MNTVLIFNCDWLMQLLCTLETLLPHGGGLEDTTNQVRLRARDNIVQWQVYERVDPRAKLLLVADEAGVLREEEREHTHQA